MTSPGESSVTTWVRDHHKGDPDAARKLWNRYFESLVRYARTHKPRKLTLPVDEYDLASRAFEALLTGETNGRFEQVRNRDDLWQLMTIIVQRKTKNAIKRELTGKRGRGRVRGGSAVQESVVRPRPVQLEPDDPAWIAAFREHLQVSLAALPSDDLRTVALLRLAGHSTASIAEQLGRTQRTIERKLQLIRQSWRTFL